MNNILIAIISFLAILKSADIFTDQSVALAKKIHISSFLIGFTLISLGTSLPDMVISTYSTLKGHPDIAISTFLGSAIINISLLLGTLALLTKYKLVDMDIKRNIPIMIGGTSIYLLILALNGFQMTWIIGLISIAILVVIILQARKNNHSIRMKSPVDFNAIYLIFSFATLIVAGKLCVDSVVHIAQGYNISETIIGYFILAVGISIPELVASFTMIKKGNLQLSLGNILGATAINLFLISGISSFITTLDLKQYGTELIAILFAMIMLFVFAIVGRKRLISKGEGIGLILVYIIFILVQFL